ncbi:MAG: RdgB/HAM1 family non-canonical purine NTP pyrophosphatase [Patescibacteria group bacterium]
MQLLLATGNPGKKLELSELLVNSGFEILSLDDLSPELPQETAETGSTFAENALLKATAAAEHANMRTIADDSGLEVLALNNFPGINSARWSPGSDADRCAALLEKLGAQEDRRAQFVCVICIYDPQTKESTTFTGTLQGTISTKPAGTNGFGYDPIFVPEGESKTLAQLPTAYKQQSSHRAKAIRKLITFLSKL